MQRRLTAKSANSCMFEALQVVSRCKHPSRIYGMWAIWDSWHKAGSYVASHYTLFRAANMLAGFMACGLSGIPGARHVPTFLGHFGLFEWCHRSCFRAPSWNRGSGARCKMMSPPLQQARAAVVHRKWLRGSNPIAALGRQLGFFRP